MHPPVGLVGLGQHIGYVVSVLATQLTWPGLIAGTGALGALWAKQRPRTRRLAAALTVGALSYLLFAFWLPTAVLAPAFLMPVPMLIIIAANELPALFERDSARLWVARGAALAGVALAAGSAVLNWGFVSGLTGDLAGQQTIDHAAQLDLNQFSSEPDFMLPWGEYTFALNYGRYVTHELSGFQPVDHRADFRQIVGGGTPLVTLPLTFYVFPLEQWDAWLGAPAHLSSVGPGFVQISDRPIIDPARVPPGDPLAMGNGVTRVAYAITRQADGSYQLTVYWRADAAVPEPYSVFVHLARVETPASADDILASADSSAPVYGWYPVTRWTPGEIVRDDYTFAAPAAYDGPLYLGFGMYHQRTDGSFENFGETRVRLR